MRVVLASSYFGRSTVVWRGAFVGMVWWLNGLAGCQIVNAKDESVEGCMGLWMEGVWVEGGMGGGIGFMSRWCMACA